MENLKSFLTGAGILLILVSICGIFGFLAGKYIEYVMPGIFILVGIAMAYIIGKTFRQIFDLKKLFDKDDKE